VSLEWLSASALLVVGEGGVHVWDAEAGGRPHALLQVADVRCFALSPPLLAVGTGEPQARPMRARCAACIGGACRLTAPRRSRAQRRAGPGSRRLHFASGCSSSFRCADGAPRAAGACPGPGRPPGPGRALARGGVAAGRAHSDARRQGGAGAPGALSPSYICRRKHAVHGCSARSTVAAGRAAGRLLTSLTSACPRRPPVKPWLKPGWSVAGSGSPRRARRARGRAPRPHSSKILCNPGRSRAWRGTAAAASWRPATAPRRASGARPPARGP